MTPSKRNVLWVSVRREGRGHRKRDDSPETRCVIDRSPGRAPESWPISSFARPGARRSASAALVSADRAIDDRGQTFPATFFAIVFSMVSCWSRSGTPYTRTKKIVLPFFT